MNLNTTTAKPAPSIRYCFTSTDSPWETISRPQAAKLLAMYRRIRLAVALRTPGQYRLIRAFDWLVLRTK